MITIQANQVRPGDIVEWRGVPHVIRNVRRERGAAWPIATDDSGWAIALGAQPVHVLRAAA